MHGIDIDTNKTKDTLLSMREKISDLTDRQLRSALHLLIDIAYHVALAQDKGETDIIAHTENIKANIKMLNHWHYLSNRYP